MGSYEFTILISKPESLRNSTQSTANIATKVITLVHQISIWTDPSRELRISEENKGTGNWKIENLSVIRIKANGKYECRARSTYKNTRARRQYEEKYQCK